MRPRRSLAPDRCCRAGNRGATVGTGRGRDRPGAGTRERDPGKRPGKQGRHQPPARRAVPGQAQPGAVRIRAGDRPRGATGPQGAETCVRQRSSGSEPPRPVRAALPRRPARQRLPSANPASFHPTGRGAPRIWFRGSRGVSTRNSRAVSRGRSAGHCRHVIRRVRGRVRGNGSGGGLDRPRPRPPRDQAGVVAVSPGPGHGPHRGPSLTRREAQDCTPAPDGQATAPATAAPPRGRAGQISLPPPDARRHAHPRPRQARPPEPSGRARGNDRCRSVRAGPTRRKAQPSSIRPAVLRVTTTTTGKNRTQRPDRAR